MEHCQDHHHRHDRLSCALHDHPTRLGASSSSTLDGGGSPMKAHRLLFLAAAFFACLAGTAVAACEENHQIAQ